MIPNNCPECGSGKVGVQTVTPEFKKHGRNTYIAVKIDIVYCIDCSWVMVDDWDLIAEYTFEEVVKELLSRTSHKEEGCDGKD